jgi:RNA recognition motif-containing protein
MLFVANLGFSVDDDALRNLFTEADINVVSARVVRWRWGHPRKSKGYGFVDVGSEEEQTKGIAALNDKEINNRPIVVKVAVNASQADEAKTADGATATETII